MCESRRIPAIAVEYMDYPAYNVMKKILLLGVSALALMSCSKDTIDSAGRDIAQNAIRSFEWTNVVKIESTDGEEVSRDTIASAEDGTYLDFDKDGYAYVFDGEGGSISYPYDMPTSKSMNFDKVSYQIKENIIQTTVKFTLENVDEDNTTVIEFRRK